jgi:hypothetical protein
MDMIDAYILLIDKVFGKQLLGRHSALHRSWQVEREQHGHVGLEHVV